MPEKLEACHCGTVPPAWLTTKDYSQVTSTQIFPLKNHMWVDFITIEHLHVYLSNIQT